MLYFYNFHKAYKVNTLSRKKPRSQRSGLGRGPPYFVSGRGMKVTKGLQARVHQESPLDRAPVPLQPCSKGRTAAQRESQGRACGLSRTVRATWRRKILRKILLSASGLGRGSGHWSPWEARPAPRWDIYKPGPGSQALRTRCAPSNRRPQPWLCISRAWAGPRSERWSEWSCHVDNVANADLPAVTAGERGPSP